MKKKAEILTVIISALLITILFHDKLFGINVFIFEMAFLLWLVLSNRSFFSGLYPLSFTAALVLSSAATVFTHSVFGYAIHFFTLFTFVGLLIYPQAKSLVSSFGLALSNISESQSQFFRALGNSKYKGQKVGSRFRRIRIYLIPLIIIVLFVSIYQRSNPIFDGLVKDISTYLNEVIVNFFKNLDIRVVITFLLGLIVSNYLLLRIANQSIINYDLNAKLNLERIKQLIHKPFRFLALRNEYSAGVFLLLTLNVILLILNSIDIYWVWFNFKWEGQYLKQFVHEGTYLLILSILISIVLVLYFFRGNLNFYKRNKLLKILSYIWLFQNAILAISVGVRNFHYIANFALAYKRIGVILFLLLTLYGLFSVFIKVSKGKTGFYLFKTNAFALSILLVVSAAINWDHYIAHYNFKHSDRSFLHLAFMVKLSDKALPLLDISAEKLYTIDSLQQQKFSFKDTDISADEYLKEIQSRKIIFKREWEKKTWLEWNWPEYLAYKKLFPLGVENEIIDEQKE
ncbi:MAG TPA: hypothetical protein DCQ31_14695 [Bacteroidales bacterium]|nr:hypothetical protein [Bacteroidales bacterium]